jgi:GNAT superfamily N-acetyltransferase
MKTEIRVVDAEATLEMRSRVMKPFLTPQECRNPGDDDPLTLHLAAYQGDRIVGIATFLPEAHLFFPKAKTPYRLRGMASDPSLHRQGVGRSLVDEGVRRLVQRGCDLLWFNAREKAFPFYEALGYTMVGEMFDIDRIGPHKVMYKVLR